MPDCDGLDAAEVQEGELGIYVLPALDVVGVGNDLPVAQLVPAEVGVSPALDDALYFFQFDDILHICIRIIVKNKNIKRIHKLFHSKMF